MTQDVIKKIAERSATEALDAWRVQSIGLRKLIADGCIRAINALSADFFIVEKSKVREEMEAAQWHMETAEGMNIQFGKGMAKGQIMVLEELFGPDAFKDND